MCPISRQKSNIYRPNPVRETGHIDAFVCANLTVNREQTVRNNIDLDYFSPTLKSVTVQHETELLPKKFIKIHFFEITYSKERKNVVY